MSCTRMLRLMSTNKEGTGGFISVRAKSLTSETLEVFDVLHSNVEETDESR